MSFSRIQTAQIKYLKPKKVDVEVDISRGLHSFNIVGLGDKSVEEAKDRVSSAIKNSGYKSPKQKSEKVVVSLAPAYYKKQGSLFDVAIALGYLESAGEIEIENKKDKFFLGELSLNGKLRYVNGILPLTKFAKDIGIKEIFVPKINSEEAAIVKGIKVFGVNSLEEIINHLKTKNNLQIKPQKETCPKDIKNINNDNKNVVKFEDIKGQEIAKRGLKIAAAGNHNIALFGPPGTGKTLLAKAFHNIFPELSFKDILEISSIHSAAGILKNNLLINRPFRSPHHSASYAAICGGGVNITPGEITLAHKGILFLDEFPEFDRKVIDSLRQPLEEGSICISRASGTVNYPADFLLIATLNPCPCGYLETGVKDCVCSPFQINKYVRKISGPIIDRIDMWIEVGSISQKDLLENKKVLNQLSSLKIKGEVSDSILLQTKRQGIQNASLSSKEIEKYCYLNSRCIELLSKAAKKMNLSARSTHKIIKISKTISDLDKSKEIKEKHILEALQYRRRN